MMKMPRYCYSCGAYLMGGATEHKPDCEILRLIREATAATGEQTRKCPAPIPGIIVKFDAPPDR